MEEPFRERPRPSAVIQMYVNLHNSMARSHALGDMAGCIQMAERLLMRADLPLLSRAKCLLALSNAVKDDPLSSVENASIGIELLEGVKEDMARRGRVFPQRELDAAHGILERAQKALDAEEQLSDTNQQGIDRTGDIQSSGLQHDTNTLPPDVKAGPLSKPATPRAERSTANASNRSSDITTPQPDSAPSSHYTTNTGHSSLPGSSAMTDRTRFTTPEQPARADASNSSFARPTASTRAKSSNDRTPRSDGNTLGGSRPGGKAPSTPKAPRGTTDPRTPNPPRPNKTRPPGKAGLKSIDEDKTYEEDDDKK